MFMPLQANLRHPEDYTVKIRMTTRTRRAFRPWIQGVDRRPCDAEVGLSLSFVNTGRRHRSLCMFGNRAASSFVTLDNAFGRDNDSFRAMLETPPLSRRSVLGLAVAGGALLAIRAPAAATPMNQINA